MASLKMSLQEVLEARPKVQNAVRSYSAGGTRRNNGDAPALFAP